MPEYHLEGRIKQSQEANGRRELGGRGDGEENVCGRFKITYGEGKERLPNDHANEWQSINDWTGKVGGI